MPLQLPRRVPVMGFYYHYKHDPGKPVNHYAYEVIGVGFHTGEDCRPGERHFVILRPVYKAAVYGASQEFFVPCFDMTPLEMWMNDVAQGEKTTPRFKLIDDPDIISQLKKIRGELYAEG